MTVPTAAPPQLDLADEVRLAAVRRVIGVAGLSEGLDRITALAALLLDASYSQVSLLAEEQVVASAAGFDLGDDRTGPLEASLCTVTVRSGGPLSVPDAATDARVSTLPPVRAGKVGAYLGVPLVDSAGLVLGALCVYDARARSWSAEHVGILGELAASVVAELELQALTHDMLTSVARMELAMSAADIGSFDYDLDSGELTWDDRLLDLFAYQRDDFDGSIRAFESRLHPGDRLQVAEWLQQTIESGGDLAIEYRIVRPDGDVRWVQARGRVLGRRASRKGRLLGLAYDWTELRDTRDRLARVLETMSDAFFSLDRSWCFTYVNAEAERVLGRPREQLLGREIWTEFPAAVGSVFEERYREAMDEHRPVSFEAHYPVPLDAWYEVRGWPQPDGLGVYFHDITSRRSAEQAREDAYRDREQAVVERERAYAAAEAANTRLALLADATTRLSASLEPEQVLQDLADIVVPGLGRWVAIAMPAESAAPLVGDVAAGPDRVVIVHTAHGDAGQQVELSDALHRLPLTTGDPHGVGAVIRTGTAEWLPQVTTEALADFGWSDDVTELARGVNTGAALTVPLTSRGRRLGAMTVGGPASGLLDRALVVDLAARAAVALDNALLYRKERHTGITLQRSLLPREVPQLPDLEVAVRYLPGTSGAFVGGDWYQGVPVAGRLLLAMGDVMGHGMRSAARMGQLRAIVATLALEGHGPGDLLHRLATSCDELLDLELATLLVALYDPAERTLTVASAGHPPPLHAPLGGEPVFLDVVPGPPLGTFPGSYVELALDVAAGDTLVLYTDGLVENRTEPLEHGLERLRSALRDIQLPPEAVADHLLEQTGRAEGADDDVALLVLSHALTGGSGGGR